MNARTALVHAVVAVVLLAGASAASTGSGGSARRAAERDVDLVASAQPSDQRRADRDVVVDEVVVRRGRVKADTVATTTTACDGCRGESAVLQVVHVRGPGAARVDNVASAWTQDCWDCGATALAVQLVVVGRGTRARATNRSLAAGAGCATCGTAAAAFQLVVQSDDTGRLPDEVRAELLAWFGSQQAVLREAAAVPPAPRSSRRATRAADRSLLALRRTVVRALDARTLSARVGLAR